MEKVVINGNYTSDQRNHRVRTDFRDALLRFRWTLQANLLHQKVLTKMN